MQKLFDFSGLPVIDNHCHLFNIDYTEHSLAGVLNMSLNDMPGEQLTNTLFYRKMLLELGKFLGVSGSQENIKDRRKEAMLSDYPGYVNKLFEDANIHTLLIDLGYKPAQVSLKAFEDLVPCRVRYVYRIETVLDEIWKEKPDFPKAEEKFYQALDDAVSSLNIVALKSIIGYRTGLDVRERHRSDFKGGITGEKEFREYFLQKAIEKCLELNIPMQIHASFGESNLNLLHNNPLLLKGLLDDTRWRAKIVLVHGGYPYSFEAGYLAAMYPNVYLDISEMVPFVPLGMRSGLKNMLDMCPLTKIMYGSDGFVLPEIHWLGAKSAKEALADIFAGLVEVGLFDEEYALQVAGNIFFNTARDIYRMTD